MEDHTFEQLREEYLLAQQKLDKLITDECRNNPFNQFRNLPSAVDLKEEHPEAYKWLENNLVGVEWDHDCEILYNHRERGEFYYFTYTLFLKDTNGCITFALKGNMRPVVKYNYGEDFDVVDESMVDVIRKFIDCHKLYDECSVIYDFCTGSQGCPLKDPRGDTPESEGGCVIC